MLTALREWCQPGILVLLGLAVIVLGMLITAFDRDFGFMVPLGLFLMVIAKIWIEWQERRKPDSE